MENELRRSLLDLAAIYSSARGIKISTLARLAAGDWRFFNHLLDEDRTFTARKYDDVVRWFSDNWPDGAPWPENVDRPPVKEDAA